VKYWNTLLLGALCLSGLALAAESEPEDVNVGTRRDEKRLDISAYRARLRKPEFDKVKLAAEELARTHEAAALPLFWSLYMEGDAQRRLLAIRCLAEAGQKGEEDKLFRVAIGDLFQAIRLAAVDALARLETRDAASARFIKALGGEKVLRELGRFRALQAIARLNGEGAAAALKACLQGKDSELAVGAAEGLSLLGDVTQADPLLEALNSADAELKPAACEALERLTGKDFRFDLVKWSEWQKEQKLARAKNPISPSEQKRPAEYEVPQPPAWNERPVDLVIVFDTTRSLLKIWPQMSAAMDAVLAEFIKRTPSLRIGTVKYRAANPEMTIKYMIEPKPLTRKLQSMRDDLLDASFGGGSGGLHLGLLHALNAMTWRAEARKIILIVGDTTPEGNGLRTCTQLIADAWQMDSVLVHTLYVRSAHGEEHIDSYRFMASAGMGRFYEYNKAEKHLVEMSAEKVNVRDTELPAQTAEKWMAPRK